MLKLFAQILICLFLLASTYAWSSVMAAGKSGYILLVDANGSAWSCGNNDCGQLGYAKKSVCLSMPEEISNLPPVEKVAAGKHHSLFVDEEGCVWACGSTVSGLLGLGRKKDVLKVFPPQKLSFELPIKAVAAGDDHSLFLGTNGTVWFCGYMASGPFGQIKKPIYIEFPRQITELPTISEIKSGSLHSLFLDIDGQVWVCRSSLFGQTGFGKEKHIFSPKKIPDLPAIISMAGGEKHTLLLDINEKVWSCGDNTYRQLGYGYESEDFDFDFDFDRTCFTVFKKIPTLSYIVKIAAGDHHSLFLNNNGIVWVCGSNKDGQLGLAEVEIVESPCQMEFSSAINDITASGRLSLMVDKEGAVYWFGTGGKVISRHPTKISLEVPVTFPDKHKQIKSAQS